MSIVVGNNQREALMLKNKNKENEKKKALSQGEEALADFDYDYGNQYMPLQSKNFNDSGIDCFNSVYGEGINKEESIFDKTAVFKVEDKNYM